jgi:hypothetical protein
MENKHDAHRAEMKADKKSAVIHPASQGQMKGGKKTNTELYVQLGIIAVLALVIVFNAGKIYSSPGSTGFATGVGTVSAASDIIPTGMPAVYGSEIGVNYDDVSPSNPQGANMAIAKLKNLDNTITLQGTDLERYISVVSQISCEYCCGAKSIIFEDGKPACGCAHSYAMRGLAKYLITEHGAEYTDEEILSEIGKWKVLFFPGIHEGKAQALEAQGIDSTDYVNLASNKYRGIEKGQASGGGGMVGGC